MIHLKGEDGMSQEAMMAIVMCTLLQGNSNDAFNRAIFEAMEQKEVTKWHTKSS